MAAALPVIASFVAGSAGITAIGAATTVLGTIAGYATVAGAVLTGVGALTGKKDLMKIGGVLSLAGGLGTLASNASSAASSGVGEIVDATGGLETAVESTANTGISAGAGAAGASVPVTPPKLDMGVQMPTPGGDAAAQLAPGGAPQSLSEVASMRAGGVAPAVPQAATAGAPSIPGVPDALSQGAQNLSQNDILNYVEKLGTTQGQPSIWDRVNGVGKWIESNPNAAKLVGEFVPGAVAAYGQARQEDLLRQQQQYQQSLMDQARARLNSPVRITYGGR
jgi:hypothetical protein